MSDSFDKTPEDAPGGRTVAPGAGDDAFEYGIDYPGMVQEALRQVARKALTQVAEEGLPGAHHVYLSFRTGHPGVGLSEGLRAQYPDEMTIVLQHDFRYLEVDDVGFDVTLRFGGVPQGLRIPFTALTSFFDPSVHFLLRFDGADDAQDDEMLLEDAAARRRATAVRPGFPRTYCARLMSPQLRFARRSSRRQRRKTTRMKRA